MSNPLLDTSSLPRFSEIAPEHVVPAISEVIDSNRARLDALLADDACRDFDSLVKPLEEMEHQLSRVWSPVSHLQAVLGAQEWREAYNRALPLLTEYGTEVSQNARLQQAYAEVGRRLSEDAGPARRSAVEHALREFRLAGVDLEDEAKTRFREIMLELAATQAQFEHNVQDASDAWALAVTDEAELEGLPAGAKRRAENEARRREEDGWVLTLDYPNYDAVLTHAENRELRETFYRAWVTRGSDQGADAAWDNTENISRILALRHEAAELVGFDNFAEYSLATKMAPSTDEVISFLEELVTHTRPAAERELDELERFAGTGIEPWDVAFWLEKLKQERHSISNEELRQYFPADTVIEGLFDLAGRLYDVSIEKRSGIEIWHPDAGFFEVVGADGNVIGGFYTDLFARSGKRSGAWIADCVDRKNLNSDKPTLPVGFLVCNFSPPEAGGESTLTHIDIVTLFHEFGHMLHHLLTQVDVPSVAGINGVPWDAVELPSQFMENFAWSYDVLARCSRHVDSGEPMPAELHARLEDSRHVGAALAMLRQIEFGMFDLRLHAEYSPDRPVDPLELLDEVRRDVSLIAHPDYNRMPHGFAHVFAGGYAAGYYSYKWAEVLAADAFAAFEESGIFDRATADRFRREILEVGGSRDFMEAYVAFRGRKPEIDALLRQSGIVAE